jgi:ketosteroid isomerase-like protein
MSQRNVDIVRRGLDAFNSEDIERIIEFIHPDFETEVPPQYSAEPDTYVGHEGVRRYFETFREAMDEIRFQVEQLWDAGDAVVLALRLTARGRQTAIPVEQRLAQVWRVRDGKAVRVTTYSSVPEALEAAGLLEPH